MHSRSRMYLSSTPKIIKALAHQMTWSGPETSPSGRPAVYLTFDDGPHPEITREVAGILKDHEALATFFCVGANAERHPDVIHELTSDGHALGNHTQNHCSGWQTENRAYYRSYLEAAGHLPEARQFRPPYGRITRSQAECIRQRQEIVMWDVLSRDWEPKLTSKDCLSTLEHHTRPGSIVVFHDSEKAAPRMIGALRGYLKWLGEQGYEVCLLPAKKPQPSEEEA